MFSKFHVGYESMAMEIYVSLVEGCQEVLNILSFLVRYEYKSSELR